MQRGRALMVAALHLAVLAGPRDLHAEPIPEYELKAAYLYNFMNYTTWPELPNLLRLCVLGPDNFGGALEKLSARTVQGKPIHIASLNSPAQARGCQLLFVTEREAGNMDTIERLLGDAPTLVVTDTPTTPAAAIQLALQNGRLVFDVDLARLRRSGLMVSAKVLSLARSTRN